MLDCAIIGGGPAGLTAGLYTTRGGLDNVIMYEKGLPGGQITMSSEIENYPGVTGHITGMDLMIPWPEQCQKFGLKHEMAEVSRISRREDGIFLVHKSDGTSEEAKSVIVCTGSTPKRAGFTGEDTFFGRGVSTCATCDGFFYKNKEVAVIGGGDTALEEALYLAKICTKVYLIHRRDGFRAAPNTIARVKASENIELVLNAVPEEVFGGAMGVDGIRVKLQDGSIRQIDVPGVFTFVGHNVNNQVLIQEDGSFLCEMTPWGEVKVDLNMKTSIPGLFAAGDLRESAPKQVVCAAGDGAVAALQAIAYVDGHQL
ncbi:thioredoxin-disulfide reductase [Sulfuricurvum sp.]|uniref:thioredoxin-disulfide reductase n=1 Tax=Sulfuricurvum sp. TaxID=2025608 RepID=UPI0019C70C19|nr:thioredoxin-disulfide reductase [Sulfuricurvum sp.]MBD3799548.1 thioredoxin-disulfide reductase [Campylobacterota bacterium]MBD3806419.1 thioredoxin-disulfide reductase [Sulfuricurvum sp.]